jgi:putative AdoMet-dependent methyltransferase
MNTKTVCKQLNISPKALRVYENLEIVSPERFENNYRNYNEKDILKLRQVILLKELGLSLASIKKLLGKEIDEKNDMVRGLGIQLSAVENKIRELENIKLTLKQSINDALSKKHGNCNEYLDNITTCLNENRESSLKWMDKWGFDSWAKRYDDSIMNSSWDELVIFDKYDFVLDTVVRKILNTKAKKVVDFGCGTANLYGKLNSDIEYIGIDQSIEMLLQAKNKFPNINFRLGNFLDEPIMSSEFDVVVSTYAFHHLSKVEKEKAIILLLKYLKTSGKIIIADLMFLNEDERIKQKEYYYKNDRKDLWDAIEDEYYTNIEEMKEYAEILGCIVNYERINKFVWVLEIIKGDNKKGE